MEFVLGTYYLVAVAVSSYVLHSLCSLICVLFVCVKCEVPVHHRGEETDLGTSRSLTRLPSVPRNTVGRGRTEPRIIDFRSLLYVIGYLFFAKLVPCGLRIILIMCYVLFDICHLLFVTWYLIVVICYLLGVCIICVVVLCSIWYLLVVLCSMLFIL